MVGVYRRKRDDGRIGKMGWKGKEGRGGRGGIGELNLGMTASDDELRPRRWSGRTAKNGKHPHALKPLQITGLFKSRDLIIQYAMYDMVPFCTY